MKQIYILEFLYFKRQRGIFFCQKGNEKSCLYKDKDLLGTKYSEPQKERGKELNKNPMIIPNHFKPKKGDRTERNSTGKINVSMNKNSEPIYYIFRMTTPIELVC